MTRLFKASGDYLDPGYINLRAGKYRTEQVLVQALEAMWARYEPYADPDFVQAFARDPEARFWEMFIGCALLDAGKTLQSRADRRRDGGHPDLCVLDGKQRIWIEAIAPTSGESGYDPIPEIVPLNKGGGVQAQPVTDST